MNKLSSKSFNALNIRTIFLLFPIFFTACISSYHTIKIESNATRNENFNNNSGLIITSCNTEVLERNRHINKKAKKESLQLIPLTFTNMSSDTLTLSIEKLEIFNNLEPTELIPLDIARKKIDYNLFGRGVLAAICIAGSFQYGSMVTSAALNFYSPFLYGTPFSIYYLIQSAKSNQNFKTDLLKYEIDGMSLLPNETKIGIAALKSKSIEQLNFRYIMK